MARDAHWQQGVSLHGYGGKAIRREMGVCWLALRPSARRGRRAAVDAVDWGWRVRTKLDEDIETGMILVFVVYTIVLLGIGYFIGWLTWG